MLNDRNASFGDASFGDAPLGGAPFGDDPILDVCLEEVLGGCQPPDLSARILAALDRATAQAASRRPIPIAITPAIEPASATSESLHGEIVVAASRGAPSHRIQEPAAASSRSRPLWLSLALAAGLLLMVGFWSARRGAAKVEPDHALGPLAEGQTGQANTSVEAKKARGARRAVAASDADDKPAASAVASMPDGNRAERPLPSPATDRAANETSAVVKHDGEGRPADATQIATDSKSPAAEKIARDEQPAADRREVASASALGGLSPSAVSDAEIIAYIDRALRARWQDSAVRPSPAATDAEWCRRVYLDLIGRIPTIQELESYLVDNSRAKRARLVDELLASDEYAEAYARHWTTIWTTLLVGRKGGMEPGSPVNREGLQQYLRRSFLANKPYDRLVYELVSAQGANRPGEDDFNGAVNFLLNNLQEKATPATAKTAQLFLGVQVQCTQCHGHPFNQWKQNRFWELNSFFRQAKAVPAMRGSELFAVRLVDEDFAGEGQTPDPQEAEIYYEERNGLMHAAYPVFLDGTESERSGLVEDVRRRDELARWIVRSDEFAQAIVNRMWAHAFGYGFTRPIDDLGPHNPVSHPQLLARLGRDFAGSGFDLKRLLRWITLSEAYGLSSKFGSKFGNAADDPTTGAPPLFSHFYLRQMTAEQLYDSLLIATEAHAAEGNYEQQQRTKDQWLEQFAIAFGTDENDEATTFDGTIAQALEMMNGELTKKATSAASGGFLSKVAQAGPRAANPVNQLYLAALGRRPSRAELQLANQLLTAKGGDAAAVLEDVWWALLNSNEFISNH